MLDEAVLDHEGETESEDQIQLITLDEGISRHLSVSMSMPSSFGYHRGQKKTAAILSRW